MPQSEYRTQSEKFDFVSGQHGGYHRHNFVDHSYLYNLYFPPDAIMRSLKNQFHELVLNYPVAQDSIAQLIGRVIDQPTQGIVVGNGTAELIKILSGHVSKRLIVPVPSFNEYANASSAERVVEFPLQYPSFQIDVDKFASEAIRVEADVAVVVTPNNPTSLLIPKADLIRLAKRLQMHDCMLIIDESFMDFALNSELTTMERDLEEHPNVAVVKSMSKTYGICGLRIGYMVTANLAFAGVVRNGLHIWNINGIAEAFLRLLPEFRQEYVQSCARVRDDRDTLYATMCEIDGMIVFKPDANFVYCRIPDDVSSSSDVTRQLFILHNSYVKDCVDKNQPDSDRYLRIASRTKEENRRVVAALIDVMQSESNEVIK